MAGIRPLANNGGQPGGVIHMMRPNRRATTAAGSGVAHAGLMYFGYFAALGAYLPFINLYYQRLGLSGIEIGTLAAIPLLVSSATALVWGTAADALSRHRLVLGIALLGSPAAVLLISGASRYAELAPLVALYALFNSAIVPLLDSAALEAAQESGRDYGGLRVWGTIGWSISTWAVGALIQDHGTRLMFTTFAAVMGLTWAASLFGRGRRPRPALSIGHGLRRLLLRADVAVFLGAVFLLSTTTGAVTAFFSIYLDELGAGEGMIGLAWMLSSLSEIPVMLGAAKLQRRVGTSGLLLTGFAMYALRWGLFSIIRDPVLALLPQLLHGLSFACFLVGGVTFISERAPEGLGTTAQSVFSTVSYGLAAIVGTLGGGLLYDRIGMAGLFRVLLVTALASVVVLWAALRIRQPRHVAPGA
jgi:PPP family 3-phenylpropionic acid transporter